MEGDLKFDEDGDWDEDDDNVRGYVHDGDDDVEWASDCAVVCLVSCFLSFFPSKETNNIPPA